MSNVYWKMFCWMSCLTGCVWQINDVTQQYFDYDHVTQVKLSTHSHRNRYFPPVLTFCHHRANIIPESLNSTPKNFFEATPTTREITKLIAIHDPHNFVVNEFTNPVDYEKFVTIEKSVKQSYLCYSIRFKKTTSFPLYYLTNSYVSPKFFSFHSNGSAFVNCESTFFFMNSATEGFYGKSETFTENFRRITDKSSGQGDANLVTISYTSFTEYRLPKPYKTKCVSYTDLGYKSQKHCFDSCFVNKSISQLGKIPFSVMVDEPLDIPFVHFEEDVRNEKLFKKLRTIEYECLGRCEWKNCVKKLYVPKIMTSRPSNSPAVEFYVSNTPEIIATYVPRLKLLEFAIYCLSCISFWISFSPLVFFQSKMFSKMVKSMKGSNSNTLLKVRPQNQTRMQIVAMQQKLDFLLKQSPRPQF